VIFLRNSPNEEKKSADNEVPLEFEEEIIEEIIEVDNSEE